MIIKTYKLFIYLNEFIYIIKVTSYEKFVNSVSRHGVPGSPDRRIGACTVGERWRK